MKALMPCQSSTPKSSVSVYHGITEPIRAFQRSMSDCGARETNTSVVSRAFRWERCSEDSRRGDEFARRPPSHEYELHDATLEHRARPSLVHGKRGALSARAPRPLLSDARLLRGVRGPRPGDLPARVAPARDIRGPLVAPRVALQDRDERLP